MADFAQWDVWSFETSWVQHTVVFSHLVLLLKDDRNQVEKPSVFSTGKQLNLQISHKAVSRTPSFSTRTEKFDDDVILHTVWVCAPLLQACWGNSVWAEITLLPLKLSYHDWNCEKERNEIPIKKYGIFIEQPLYTSIILEICSWDTDSCCKASSIFMKDHHHLKCTVIKLHESCVGEKKYLQKIAAMAWI